MTMSHIVINAKPISATGCPYLLLDNDGVLSNYYLRKGKPVCFTCDTRVKYCTGWYDIETHQNHLCESQAIVDTAYDSCYACRQKTEFNPAFYNTAHVSEKQAKYNKAPHTVYVAYFGNSLAKAGIMSDSRGIERLYEQGALLYGIIARCPDATIAHNLEDKLIQKGLRNSVSKKQKADVFQGVIDADSEQVRFRTIVDSVGYVDVEIATLLDTFFFGSYPKLPIQDFGGNPISGKVVGAVGRYLVLENNGRLYGFLLSKLFGYKITIGDEINLIERKLEQVNLL